MKIPSTLLLALLLLPGIAPAQEAPPAASPPLRGEVIDVLDAGAFTYLRLKTANGETWAGVPRTSLSKGAQVTIDNPVAMQDFESRALQRRFDVVYFGRIAAAPDRPAGAAPAPHGAVPTASDPGRLHGSPSSTVDPAPVKVAKAEGAEARTVAEVHAERLALKDRTVKVRATVTKVTAGVMGRNWIHLRDGSGSAADGSNDIVATSPEEPKVGDVVIARGTVRTDVDFGSGYAYRVLVEDTTFRK